MVRILYMVQFFEPEPAFKGLSFAKKLQAAGYEVEVLTGFPNYPGGKVYSGYRIRALKREVMDGIPVVRVPIYPSHDNSAVRRMMTYCSFAASSLIYGLFRAGRADVIYVYHPPLTVSLAAMIVGAARRRPFVVDIQDLWPDTLAATGMVRSKRLLRWTDWLCRLVYRRAQRIAVQSFGFKKQLIDRGVAAEKIDVILNWADDRETTPKGVLDLAPFALEGRFNVIFAGTMGFAQGLDVILEAAKLLLPIEPRVQFILVGSGVEVERLKRRIAAEGLTNVRQVSQVRRDLVIDALAGADVLLATLKPDPLFEITIPSKTQFYLAVGRPIVLSVKGDAARLVEASGAGLTVEPGDSKALAEAVLSLARMPPDALTAMGRRGREYYERELSIDIGMAKTVATIDHAIATWQRRGRR